MRFWLMQMFLAATVISCTDRAVRVENERVGEAESAPSLASRASATSGSDGNAVSSGATRTPAAIAVTPQAQTVAGAASADTATAPAANPGFGARTGGMWVTGYWAAWTAGNMLDYPYTNIDWTALTHLTVALAYPDSQANLAYVGGNLDSVLAKQVTAAAHAHGRKALLMIGGAGSNSDLDAAVLYGANAPQTFVKNIVTFAQGDGFDGVDIDWETLSSDYYTDFKTLATALRSAWPGMILTCPVGWDQTDSPYFGTLKDAAGSWLFNQFNVMNYDAANNWQGWVSWFFNALAGDGPDHPSSVETSLNSLNTTGGVPRALIGMGIPFYGSAWTGGNPPVTGPRQAVGGGASATQGQDSTWPYNYIMTNYYQAYNAATGVGYVFDAAAGVPYIAGGANGFALNGQPPVTFLSFEDPTSIAGKGAWAKANGYGGTIIWLINEGATDASGTNPLLTAVKAAFLN